MTYPHQITVSRLSQGTESGYRVAGASEEGVTIAANVQPLSSRESYEALGVEETSGFKVFVAPDTVIPPDARVTYRGKVYAVVGDPEPHIYGSSLDHLRLIITTVQQSADA